MTVKDLREELAKHPDDMEIIMSSDGEGNHYHRAFATDVVSCMFGKWEVELCGPEDQGYEYPEEDGKLCLILWPE